MPTSPTDAPDINLWIALTDPDHAHHPRAKRYWESEKPASVAFFNVTFFGMLRLLTNPRTMHGDPFTAPEAWEIGKTYLALPEASLLPDSPGIHLHLDSWSRTSVITSKLWTDAWIAALALEHRCRVVSFDSDFTRFPGLDFLHLRP